MPAIRSIAALAPIGAPCALAALGTLAVLVALAACSKPITFAVTDTQLGSPLEGVQVHRHSVSIFSPLPKKRTPSATDFTGASVIWVPPDSTNLTFLRQGYEPTAVGVFRVVPGKPAADGVPDPDAPWQLLLCWDDLAPKIPVSVCMRPLRTEVARVLVTDESGAPLPDCEVLAATFLYLPLPGAEPEWGFPPLQRSTTDAHGETEVLTYSGFRNRVTARMPGRAEVFEDLVGASTGDIRLQARRLEYRPQRYRIVDRKGKPIAGAQVSFGEIRNGLPVSPNGFVVESDAEGFTSEVQLPNADRLILTVRARGYKDRLDGPVWRTLEPGGTRRIVLERR